MHRLADRLAYVAEALLGCLPTLRRLACKLWPLTIGVSRPGGGGDKNDRGFEALHAAGHEIAAVYCQPPKPAGRG